MLFMRESKLALLLCAGRKLLGLSVSMEIDLFFVTVVQIYFISVYGIGLDLISV